MMLEYQQIWQRTHIKFDPRDSDYPNSSCLEALQAEKVPNIAGCCIYRLKCKNCPGSPMDHEPYSMRCLYGPGRFAGTQYVRDAFIWTLVMAMPPYDEKKGGGYPHWVQK